MSDPGGAAMQGTADSLPERVARRVSDWRLDIPALAFLYAHMPLAFVSSQALLVLQPILDLLAPRDATSEWVALLGDRAQLARLIRRLESEKEDAQSV